MDKYSKFAINPPHRPAGNPPSHLANLIRAIRGKRWPLKVPINDYLLLTFFVFTISACTPDPPPTLNYKDRQIVDSLFRLQVDSLKPLFDSLCDVRFDSAVQRAVDSIIDERQSEKDKYLERLRREMNRGE